MLVGIIGAMNEEIIELKSVMEIKKETKIGNLIFFEGIICDKNVVLVECGIGKVNGAICATIMTTIFKVDKLIFTGVAGGVNPQINIGDIVIGEDLIQADFDCTAFGYELGKIPRMEEFKFRCDTNLRELALNVAKKEFGNDKIYSGTIVSGDQFISSDEKIKWLRKQFGANCTEMEGAAVAHVCYVFNVPFLVIRAISDKADDDAKVDYPEFVKLAAKNSKTIVEGILKELN